ncbi:ATP-binding protein [Helicobacter pylori]|nr:ATP-binding protein [Helicobacter pylori]
MSVLDTAMNLNSVLMIDNLNEAKELHDKIGVEKLRSFLEKATDNERIALSLRMTSNKLMIVTILAS